MLNKKIKVYAVTKQSTPGRFITVTTTKDQAIEYINRLLKCMHEYHYNLWRAQRNLTDEYPAWNKYLNDCISDEEKGDYLISPIYYNTSAIASILRMFCKCVPLGCSYELDTEQNLFEQYFKDNFKDIINLEEQDKDSTDSDDDGPWGLA